MPGLRWRGLTLQLFVVIVLPITALLLVVAFGGVALHQNAMRGMVGERDERAVRSAAGAIREQILHRSASVQLLAQRASDGIAPAQILSTSDFLRADFDGGLAFFTPDGNLLTSDRASAFESEPEGLQTLLSQSSDQPKFSSAMIDPASGAAVVLVSAMSNRQSIAVGAFSPAMPARQTLGPVFSGEETGALLVDSGGRALYRAGTLASEEHSADHPGVAEALRGESGTAYFQTDHGEHVVAYSPVDPVGWALIVEEPWEHVASPLLTTTQAAPLVLVPVLLLALIALWFGARQIVRPLQALETKAADLTWGRFDAIEEPVGGIAEIQHLQAELAHMARKVKQAQASLRGYIGAITAGQEDERRRLARELHDDTLQSLIALNQRVQLARLDLGDHPAQSSLAELQQLAEQTIENLRRFTRALRPIYLEDLGLVTALEMLARETHQSVSLSADFRKVGAEQRLAPEVELTLYRIAQEALSNVTRHAQAAHASITLAFNPRSVTLTVVDDGRGFAVPDSPAEFAPGGHFGLLGMHERAELISAHLKIESAPGRGTRVTVELPTVVPDPDGAKHRDLSLRPG